MQIRSTVSTIILISFLGGVNRLPAQSIPPNQLVLPTQSVTISFCWQGDSVHSRWEEHQAILIAVTLKNCARRFFMQFDLGSPYSLLYINKLNAIQKKYPAAIPGDSVAEMLRNFSFTADRMPVVAKEMMVKQFDSSSINWEDENSVEIIGKLGSDLVDGKVAIIDYPDQTLTLAPAIPPKLAKRLSLTHFIYANRSVLLPVKINSRETLLYFDTGSSMFELLTNKEICLQLAVPDTAPVKLETRSWDKSLTANTFLVKGTIEIAGNALALHAVTYIEGVSKAQEEHMLRMGIGGMTGNKLFLNHILVLDTKEKMFGLLPGARRGKNRVAGAAE